MTHRYVPALVLPLAFAACAADGRTAASIVRDSAGIRIVENSAPSWGEAAPSIDPVPVVTIGREEEGPYQFAGISGAVLLTDGTIAAADYRAGELRLFDSAGVHIRSFGRSGEGPGEFRITTAVLETRGDSVAVFDQGLYRTTIFPIAGGEPRIVANPITGNYVVLGILRDGSLLLYNPGQYRRGRAEGLQWDSSDIVLAGPGGESPRVIARLPISEDYVGADGEDRGVIPPRFAMNAVAPDGFYWATSDRWEVVFRDTSGAVKRILRRSVAPRPVTDADRRAYIEAQLDRVRRWEGEDAVPRYRRHYEEESYFGEHVPLFAHSFVDSEERLWVGHNRWPAEGSPTRWSVFARDGVWLGDLDAPERTRLVDASAAFVLGIWTDENDVQHVRLHRLTSAES